ncbi:MAG TPA: serine/threonine-protein kinase [Bryobacteraceae bacterium]|nr:serine/threonine-protein kinase [Bryobacteraceae bacterium]
MNEETYATRTVAALRPATPKSPSGGSQSFSVRGPSSTSSRESRFLPGTLLAGRYRIISLIGRGGMGEVYRADDLTLEQPVALKFLPETIAANEAALSRFRNEVRIARQVSHPNVCRVYDVGEVDGHMFLSMEYVDGEDLASLLRRIGRLPTDKGIEIARKLCAGLAAAHEKGVLHRDLKPSNVMLDARGQVLLTDFGLAGLADQIAGAEVRNGTPAYMAPEQLSGKEVTARSDIYALGLVLYEIFTGRRPFEASTLAELVQAQTSTTPTSLTSLVRDLDPAVERVILRCLDPEPSRRPSSALAVAAALPGGDPLAAALAAGETPSPQMVAAAGEGVGLAPKIAISLLAVVIVCLAGYYALAVRRSALERIHLAYAPEVLSQKARDIIQGLGIDAAVTDDAYGFDWDTKFVEYIDKNDKPLPDWSRVSSQRPAPFLFWYRQSPYPLTADSYRDDLLTPGVVARDDPAPILSGMIGLLLDPQGRLLYLERIPDQQLQPAKEVSPIDWKPLFAAASLDLSKFQPSEPLRTWLATSDTRAAWTGTWPESNRPLRVEAASLRGKPVAFALISPWTGTDRTPQGPSTGARGQLFIFAVIALAIFFGGGWLAHQSLKQGRGDREGAWRLATWIGGVQVALWICRGHFAASMGTFGMAILAICTAIFYGFTVYIMYIALEPHVRRRWPQTLISWTAILTRHWRDPIVGRDVLVGLAAGIGVPVVVQTVDALVLGSNLDPQLGPTEVLLGLRSTLTVCLRSVPHGIRDTLASFLLLFLLRALLRNQWLTGAAFALFFTIPTFLGSQHPIVDGLETLLAYGLVAAVAWRFGLLALGVYIFSNGVVESTQATLHTGAWYFGNDLFLLAFILGLAVWGCYTSMAGQKLWKQNLLES